MDLQPFKEYRLNRNRTGIFIFQDVINGPGGLEIDLYFIPGENSDCYFQNPQFPGFIGFRADKYFFAQLSKLNEYDQN